MNIFDIIGPVMIGPSSSHTAGAVRLGRVANKLINDRKLVRVEITLSGSFARTYKGHGTDRALLASLKETAGGGLAATPTGRKLQKQVFGS